MKMLAVCPAHKQQRCSSPLLCAIRAPSVTWLGILVTLKMHCAHIPEAASRLLLPQLRPQLRFRKLRPHYIILQQSVENSSSNNSNFAFLLVVFFQVTFTHFHGKNKQCFSDIRSPICSSKSFFVFKIDHFCQRELQK